MNRLCFGLLLPLIVGSHGCSGTSEADRTRGAVLRVLQADKELESRWESASKGMTSPAQLALLIERYCEDMERIELTDCPADFRVAFRKHIRTWRDVHTAVSQLPNGFLDGVVLGAFNALMGEADGGTSRLQGDLRRAAENVRLTYEEVEAIGAKYGAAL